LHVCFVALKAYAVLTGEDIGCQIGGAEVQQALIARSLVKRGHRVTFLTYDYGQPGRLCIDGIEIRKTYSLRAGFPVIRFLYPRWTTLMRVMRELDADVYYQRGAGLETGEVAWFCQRHDKPFVFATGSDTDCRADLPRLEGWREKALYRYGLHRAHRVVVQSERQTQLMREAFGVEGQLIRSCGPTLVEPREARQAKEGPWRILWVGRLVPVKRPDLVIEMARCRPDWHFEVVGEANVPSGFSRRIAQDAGQLPNVKLHGPVPYPELGRFYDQADVLLCTSRHEGFPNTLLEAWTRGLPVVSTVDPDGVISRWGLGATAASSDALTDAVDRLLREGDRYRETSARCLVYVREHHSSERVVDAYEALFAGLGPRHAPRDEKIAVSP
jgi:glycosyltransferase involved in cell wall biosynthesis